MSERWYPVIDYEKCISCFSCVEFYPHDVYEKHYGVDIRNMDTEKALETIKKLIKDTDN